VSSFTVVFVAMDTFAYYIGDLFYRIITAILIFTVPVIGIIIMTSD